MAAIKATLTASIIAMRTTFDANLMQSQMRATANSSRSMALLNGIAKNKCSSRKVHSSNWMCINSTSDSRKSESTTVHRRRRTHFRWRPHQRIQQHLRPKCRPSCTKTWSIHRSGCRCPRDTANWARAALSVSVFRTICRRRRRWWRRQRTCRPPSTNVSTKAPAILPTNNSWPLPTGPSICNAKRSACRNPSNDVDHHRRQFQHRPALCPSLFQQPWLPCRRGRTLKM